MKVILSAVVASVRVVVVLLLVFGSQVSNEPRVDVGKPTESAGEQEPASKVPIPHEAAAARVKHCNINAVIYDALQSAGGGAGPICVID